MYLLLLTSLPRVFHSQLAHKVLSGRYFELVCSAPDLEYVRLSIRGPASRMRLSDPSLTKQFFAFFFSCVSELWIWPPQSGSSRPKSLRICIRKLSDYQISDFRLSDRINNWCTTLLVFSLYFSTNFSVAGVASLLLHAPQLLFSSCNVAGDPAFTGVVLAAVYGRDVPVVSEAAVVVPAFSHFLNAALQCSSSRDSMHWVSAVAFTVFWMFLDSPLLLPATVQLIWSQLLLLSLLASLMMLRPCLSSLPAVSAIPNVAAMQVDASVPVVTGVPVFHGIPSSLLCARFSSTFCCNIHFPHFGWRRDKWTIKTPNPMWAFL